MKRFEFVLCDRRERPLAETPTVGRTVVAVDGLYRTSNSRRQKLPSYRQASPRMRAPISTSLTRIVSATHFSPAAF